MPVYRRYLLSSNREVRKRFDLALVSKCDKADLLTALAVYQRMENSLEGELTGLVAALAGEPNGLVLGRKTQLVCVRLGLVTGEITRITDVARKLEVSPSTVSAHCRAVLTRLAQASLIGVLPRTPYLATLRSLLVADVDGRWLPGDAPFPASVCASGALLPSTAILVAWDVLRWPLPRVYADFFRDGPANAESGSADRNSLSKEVGEAVANAATREPA